MSKISLKPSATGTGTYTIEAPAGNLSKTLMLPDEDGTLTTVEQVLANKITLGEAKSATGTSVDFTGIPSWVKRITVMFDGVSTNGSSGILVQIGNESIEISGYVSTGITTTTTSSYVFTTSSTSGFLIRHITPSYLCTGVMELFTNGNNIWIEKATTYQDGSSFNTSVGRKELNLISRIRITTVNGTDQFDAGTINISWE